MEKNLKYLTTKISEIEQDLDDINNEIEKIKKFNNHDSKIKILFFDWKNDKEYEYIIEKDLEFAKKLVLNEYYEQREDWLKERQEAIKELKEII